MAGLIKCGDPEGPVDFFNLRADTWDEANRYPLEKIEAMLDILGIKAGDTVLDVGTGTGILLPLLMKRTEGHNITAIDFAEKMIQNAKSKFPDSTVTFITADVTTYHFTGGAFNHIICYSVFPHLADKCTAIQKLAAALKPQGLLSILHSSSRSRINGTHVHIRSHGINADYLLPAREYIPLLNRNGLEAEHIVDNEDMFMLCGRKQQL